MKNITKISLSVMALLAAFSLASCSVEYRARHPHHHHNKKVKVVGMEKEHIPSDSVSLAQSSKGIQAIQYQPILSK